jgi:small conductance mechanosensitive channel
MSDAGAHWGFLRPLTPHHVLIVAGVVVGCGLLIALVRALVRRSAEGAPSHYRLVILRAAPIARLIITIAGFAIITPLLVEPSFEDIVALIATVGLALAFALKDYVSCLVAGVVTIIENTYQPGDWIEFGGAYGEVKTIGTRAVRLVTADDTEVIIPHAMLWTSRVDNDSGGRHTLQTVTHFYLAADHDGAAVSRALAEVAAASPHLLSGSTPQVAAAEQPFGTHYRIKARVAESREQFAMVTDITLRGKERLRAMGVAFAQAPFAQTG